MTVEGYSFYEHPAMHLRHAFDVIGRCHAKPACRQLGGNMRSLLHGLKYGSTLIRFPIRSMAVSRRVSARALSNFRQILPDVQEMIFHRHPPRRFTPSFAFPAD